MLQFKNENDQEIQVEPVTVDAVKAGPEPGWAVLCISTVEVTVRGEPDAVAAALASARGYDCPVIPLKSEEPPPADGLPVGEEPPPGEPPPGPSGDEDPPAAPEPEAHRKAGKGKGGRKAPWA